jgi:hypothetical protein
MEKDETNFNHLKMSSWTWYRVALALTDVSENVSSPSSGFLKLDWFPEFHYRGNAVHSPPHRGTQLLLEDHCLQESIHGGIKAVFFDLIPCSTSFNRPFGERIASIFRVPKINTAVKAHQKTVVFQY